MSEVIEINDPAELENYRLPWQLLLPQTSRATFYQTLDWLQAYWEHSGAGQKLRVLIVQSDGATIGILPLCVRTEGYKVGGVRVLTYPLHEWGTFFGPIGPNPTATLLAGFRHIHNTPRDWDILDLRWVDNDRVDKDRTANALQQAGFVPHKALYNTAGVISLAGTFTEWWNARPSKWRTNCRRNERRLLEQGELKFERYRPLGEAHGEGDPRWDLYDACEEVARKSWQGSSATGTTICHDSVREYFRSTHVQAAKLGMLDLNLLLLNNKPIAFGYNYHYQGEVQGIRIGYDASTTANGAGNILYVRAIEDSFARQDTVYDLGVGSLDYKRFLLTHTENSYRFTHYPPLAWKAQALRAKRAWKHWRAGRQSGSPEEVAQSA